MHILLFMYLQLWYFKKSFPKKYYHVTSSFILNPKKSSFILFIWYLDIQVNFIWPTAVQIKEWTYHYEIEISDTISVQLMNPLTKGEKLLIKSMLKFILSFRMKYEKLLRNPKCTLLVFYLFIFKFYSILKLYFNYYMTVKAP